MRSPLSESATVSSSDSHEISLGSLLARKKNKLPGENSVALRELHFTRSSLPPSQNHAVRVPPRLNA